MPIEADFLRLLVCPQSHEPLRMASEEELGRVNRSIRAGTARNRAGDTVVGEIEEGLVAESGGFVYPVSEGIPNLLVEEAIDLSPAQSGEGA